MNASEIVEPSIKRRRRHSATFKASVVAACRRPGISIASVALANGLNANLLRRWVADAESDRPASKSVARSSEPPPGFIPLALPAPAKLPDIRIELQRNSTTVIVSWPGEAASASAAWLREILR